MGKSTKTATLAVNMSFNRAIRTAPYIMKFGKIPRLEIDDKLGTIEPKFILESQHRERDMRFNDYALKSIQKGKIELKSSLKAGDRVLIYKEPLKNKFSQKWWPGYTVKAIVQPSAYIVSDGKSELRLNKTHVKLDESQKR